MCLIVFDSSVITVFILIFCAIFLNKKGQVIQNALSYAAFIVKQNINIYLSPSNISVSTPCGRSGSLLKTSIAPSSPHLYENAGNKNPYSGFPSS